VSSIACGGHSITPNLRRPSGNPLQYQGGLEFDYVLERGLAMAELADALTVRPLVPD
jgi:hypothetical protein